MANNYSESSFMVPFTPKAADAAKAYFEEYSAKQDKEEEEYQDSYQENYAGLAIEMEDDAFWLSGDGEYFNPDAAVLFIQGLLNAIDCDAGVFFSWSSWCSKPRVNEFDGGSCVVTRGDTMSLHTFDILKQAAKAGVEVINA
jgi:hypothetical protein